MSVDNHALLTPGVGRLGPMRFDDRQPFTYRQGRDAGLSRRALESAAYTRLLNNVYVSSEVPVDHLVAARAVVLAAQPGAFAALHTAAQLWGGVVPHSHLGHVSVPAGVGRKSRQDLRTGSSSRAPMRFRGVPTTSPADTFLDLAAHLNLLDLVILGDSLVRKRRITPAQLAEATEQATGRGVRLARRAAGLVRIGVDSPMETRSRMLRVLSGLPELETDIRFHRPNGDLRRRLDAGDRATRSGIEYDGRHHVERKAQWEADVLRREEFENEEWRIMTLVSHDIFVHPSATVERMATMLASRGVRVGRRKDEWRHYFPGRGQGQ